MIRVAGASEIGGAARERRDVESRRASGESRQASHLGSGIWNLGFNGGGEGRGGAAWVRESDCPQITHWIDLCVRRAPFDCPRILKLPSRKQQDMWEIGSRRLRLGKRLTRCIMQRAIVIAHHLILTAYGWWLPNDPRGSGSRAVGSDVIAELGELHQGRRRVQPPSAEIREFYSRAEGVLKFPLLEFSADEIRTAADGFADAVEQHRYTCYACAVMPDHVHLLIRKHRDSAEQMIENLQESCRLRLGNSGLRSPDHPVWSRAVWKVFLDHPDDIRRTIRYIRQNPVKRREPLQEWAFVSEYDGWPLHEGHNPNSPYARRLRECGR